MFEGFTLAAKRAVLAAAEVARRAGDDMIRSDHLLVGALEAGEATPAVRLCAEAGITSAAVRMRVRDFLGASAAEDAATLGIDVREVQARVEEAFGTGALREAGPGWPQIPFAPDGKAASNQTVLEARARGSEVVDIVDWLGAVLHPGLTDDEQWALSPGYAEMARREGLYEVEKTARRVVRALGADPDELRTELLALPDP